MVVHIIHIHFVICMSHVCQVMSSLSSLFGTVVFDSKIDLARVSIEEMQKNLAKNPSGSLFKKYKPSLGL